MKRINFTKCVWELLKATVVKGRRQSKQQNRFVKEGVMPRGEWCRAG